jgi:dTDP-4-dehydrorhamnose 3,5-epimerase
MSLQVTETDLPGVLILKPKVFSDDRGFFFESFNSNSFIASTGNALSFVQDNHSRSTCGVLRGLHYQIQQPQGKLVRVIEGAIFDVAVDIRENSPTFGKWVGLELSADNNLQLWVPPDFAHGFLVVSEFAQVLYKTTDFFAPRHERSIRWDDPNIGIDWPKIATPPKLSNKDENANFLSDAELPSFSQ